ncbi:MAG: DUF3667 domain-containing protein [Planctomycetota bacterium]
MGEYCQACGERRLDPERDHSLRWLLGQLVDGLLQLDAKVLRTYRALLVRPGSLTRDHLEGRRVRTVMPFQLFLLTGLVFYLCFSHAYAAPVAALADARARGVWFGNILQYDIRGAIAAKAAATGQTADVLAMRVFDRAGQESKIFLGALVPVQALALWLLHRRHEPRFVPHLIAALHLFTVFLVFDLVFLWVWRLLGHRTITDTMFLPLVVTYAVHVFVGLRRIHGGGLLATGVRTLAFLAVFLAAILAYRQVITIVAVRLV